MREGEMEEVTGAVGLGLFAGNVVLALGRLIHGSALTDADRTNLQRVQDILEGLSAPIDAAAPPPGLRLLASSGSSMDALTAVETQAAEQDVGEFVEPLAEALRRALTGAGKPDSGALASLRTLFSAIGDAEVARVSRLSRPSAPNLPSWLTSSPSSIF